MCQSTRQLIAELIEALNSRDLERVAAFYSPDYEGVDVGDAQPHHGPDGLRRALGRYLEAFPDLDFTADSVVVEEKRIALAWTARGTHQGALLRIPPTGRPAVVRGVTLLTVQEEKIRRGLYVWDLAGLLRAIGLLPEL